MWDVDPLQAHGRSEMIGEHGDTGGVIHVVDSSSLVASQHSPKQARDASNIPSAALLFQSSGVLALNRLQNVAGDKTT